MKRGALLAAAGSGSSDRHASGGCGPAFRRLIDWKRSSYFCN
jgi:hypothetical protein